MKEKKSQITLFIILGFVLLVVIGLFLYLSKYVDKQTSHEATETQKIKAELQPIENYVTQCLDMVTKQGLEKLSSQGGYLYKSQGGPLIDYKDADEGLFFVNHNGYRVSYGISPLGSDTGGYYSKAPNYPWETFPYPSATNNDEIFEGLFGENKLPFIYFGPNSIKSQLEIYIKNNIKECIDWGVFEDTYEITENDLNVNLQIAKEDVDVLLTYPLIIKNKATGDTTAMQNFFVREDIRLQKMYNFVNNLINNDVMYMGFDISTASISGFHVQVKEDVYDKDDIIIVRDANSLINKEPYKFVFARHNRMPALYYVHRTEMTRPNGYEIKDIDLIPGGISSLKAIDPDEDKLNSSSYLIEPSVPRELYRDRIDFRIKVTDGGLEDYQTVTVLRET